MSDVDIYNAAMDELGVERVLSFSETSKQSKLADKAYTLHRQALLEDHYWNFAETRKLLAVLSSAPIFGFDLKYQLPTDCLKAKHLDNKVAKFKVEADRTLHTNLVTASLLYIIDVTDTSKMSAMFRKLLAYDIAIALCMTLTQKRTLKADLIEARKLYIRDARSSDGREGTNDELEDDEWLNARSSHGLVGDSTLDE